MKNTFMTGTGGVAPLLAVAAIAAMAGFADGQRLVLENNGFRAEIAPGLGGRVSFYAAAGESNALWFAEADAPVEGWLNHGGEKTWIGPQSSWKRLSGKGWPPPPFFDQARYEVAGSRRGQSAVVLASPADAESGLRVVREIELLPDGSLQVASRLETCGDSQSVPVGGLLLWSVAQIVLPDEVRAVDGAGSAARLVPEGEKRLHGGLGPAPLSARVGAMRIVAEAVGAEGASAAVYFTGTNAPPDRRYAELEFSAPAGKGLTVRYRLEK